MSRATRRDVSWERWRPRRRARQFQFGKSPTWPPALPGASIFARDERLHDVGVEPAVGGLAVFSQLEQSIGRGFSRGALPAAIPIIDEFLEIVRPLDGEDAGRGF